MTPRPTVLDVAALLDESHLVVGNRQRFRSAVLDRLEAGTRDFAFDCTRVGYIDASGVGVLLSVQNRVREEGGTVCLVGLNPDMRHYFAMLKLMPLFTLYPTLADVPGLAAAVPPIPASVATLPAGREVTRA